jgi:long-chain acyl-CoA synthetase
VSENRYEWIVADLAILTARAVHCPAHSVLTGPQIAYQIVDSGAEVVLLSGPEQAAKLAGQVALLPPATRFIGHDPCPDIAGRPVPRLVDLAQAATDDEACRLAQDAVATLRPGDLATILYTSGTTGEPKGVMLSHGNLASNALATVQAFDMRADDLRLTWLPLSHIFARTCDLYAWIAAGTQLALADSRETVIANCAELKPTLINGVPYFYDKIQRVLTEQGRADVPGAVRVLLGGRMRLCCSGGAALPNHVATYFQERGVLLIQGYGLTECAPVMTMNTERAHRLGTVGQAPPDIEVRIAPDGEVLTRGPHVMLGYWNKPQATAESIRDGWLHTGDLGSLDADGFLSITGRKKELIVTAGGKNIAPVMLESLLTEDALIAQAVVVGDGRNYLAALIVVNEGPLREELARFGIDPGKDWLANQHVTDTYRRRIDDRLAGVSAYEQIKKFTLLATPFTVDRDELTPTLKLRRGVIHRHYQAEIEAMYAR